MLDENNVTSDKKNYSTKKWWGKFLTLRETERKREWIFLS
jgi:hypothetical protein